MRDRGAWIVGMLLLTAAPLGAQVPFDRDSGSLPASPVSQTPVGPAVTPALFPPSVTSTFPQAPHGLMTNPPQGPGPIAQASGMTSSCSDCFVKTGCHFDDGSSPWTDNLSLYLGLNGAKEPVDLGVNANFGYRFAINWGLPLVESVGLGIQLGTAINYSRSALRVLHFVDGTVEHWQSFHTVGVFQRSPAGLNWGVVYDYRFDDYYDRLDSSQWRAQVGWQPGPDDEIGVWGTLRDRGSHAGIQGNLVGNARPLNQVNLFWRHIWPNETTTRAWVGLSESHGRFSLLIPGESNVSPSVAFGADLFVPLTDSLAIFGEAQFITPNDTGTVTATIGVAWFPGAARRAARSRFSPYLPVANSTSMPLDLRP